MQIISQAFCCLFVEILAHNFGEKLHDKLTRGWVVRAIAARAAPAPPSAFNIAWFVPGLGTRLEGMLMSTDMAHPANCTKRVLSIQSHVVHGYVGNCAATFPLQVSWRSFRAEQNDTD